LALSSRNSYLSEEERVRAPALFSTLSNAAEATKDGRRDFSTLEKEGCHALEKSGFCPDYFHIRRAEDLTEPEESDKRLIVLAAAYLGKARLIDNVLVRLK
jgi:pantoate--beta-alanine ligase